MSHQGYRKVQRAIIRKLQNRLPNQLIHFNSESWVESLAEDGINWSTEGKQRVKSKLKKTIRNFMEGEESD